MRDAYAPRVTWNGMALAAPPAPPRTVPPRTRVALPPSRTALAADPEDTCLHDLFTASARRTPAAPAVLSRGVVTTYADLDRRSDQLARALIARGTGPGSAVGISMERSADAYAAVLAVLKAGAAFVGLDPATPPERVAAIAEDSGMRVVLHDGQASLPDTIISLQLVDLEGGPTGDTAMPMPGAHSPHDLCYIIYTSGSTGRPKGVAIEHGSAVHYVRSARHIYGISASDRVWQGFSLAFDASIEEIWLTLDAGACLISGTRGEVTSGPLLATLLTDRAVTVFSCVPTALALFEHDVPSVRLLIVGGEACPPELVTRWCRPGRRMLNTYGPTEATVVATWAELAPDSPVTIGHPLPGYRVLLLDDDLGKTQPGALGQVYIGGPCLARGYVNLPGETARRFIANPYHAQMPDAPRLYASGDLARRGADGALIFRGRQDGQVKIRGFRVELGELESVLLAQPGVKAAAATVYEGVPGRRDLVGYVVLQSGAVLDRLAVLAALRAHLPGYMVPAFLETLEALPTSMSGKLDRARLPAPRPEVALGSSTIVAPEGATDQAVAAVWARVLGHQNVSAVDNFFDLGGHSLAAAQLACALRQECGTTLAVPDVYAHPTVRELAAIIGERVRASAEEETTPDIPPLPVSGLRHALCGLGQALTFYPQLMLDVLPLLPFVALAALGRPSPLLIGAAVALLMAKGPLTMGIALVAKWLLIGRYREGSHALWGGYYLRWWLVQQLESRVSLDVFAGSPLAVTYARLMGARIGRGVYLGITAPIEWDLLEVGDGASVGDAVSCHAVSGGRLHLGRVRIGRGAYVGEQALIGPGTTVEEGASLDALGMLASGATIPAGERWGGSPARRLAEADPDLDLLRAQGPAAEPARLPYMLAAAGTMALPVLAGLPELPLALAAFSRWGNLGLLLVIPPSAVLYTLMLSLLLIAVKRLLPRVQPGIAPLNSRAYLHRWIVDRLMFTALEGLPTLFGTLYTAPWLRLLGASIGRRSEVSTVAHFAPDLITLGPGSFLADDVHVHTIKVCSGHALSLPTRMAAGTFIGNSAGVPLGTILPEDCLVGVVSVAPPRAEAGSSWLGSPAIALPRRQIVEGFDAAQTITPPRRLVMLRLAIEACRIMLPGIMIGVTGAATYEALVTISSGAGLGAAVALAPVVQAFWALLMALVVVALKWGLVGRYRPRIDALWTPFVWRSELATGLYEAVAMPLLADLLLGTPFIAWYLRLLGAKIGKRTYVESPNMTEFDLVTVGDEAMLGHDCTIQTHLFEDRIFKMDRLTIGPGCAVGARSVMLYGTTMGAGTELGPLSLMMKGESFPAATRWAGIPAQEWRG
ncbi:MAG: non-ribosomal peptide synthetase [Chloroflexota bacterium]